VGRTDGWTDQRREGGSEGGKGGSKRNVSERMLLVHIRVSVFGFRPDASGSY
jgi:hypothetical protein